MALCRRLRRRRAQPERRLGHGPGHPLCVLRPCACADAVFPQFHGQTDALCPRARGACARAGAPPLAAHRRLAGAAPRAMYALLDDVAAQLTSPRLPYDHLAAAAAIRAAGLPAFYAERLASGRWSGWKAAPGGAVFACGAACPPPP